MAGITRVGAYIPFHRLDGETVRSVWGAGNRRASRPLAGFDEDPITMGVEALINAAGWGDSEVDSLYFASTTHPYAEKSNASVLAAAADLPETLFTLDAGGSVRAGTSALKAACDAIEAGSSKSAAVVAAEKRPALPEVPIIKPLRRAAPCCSARERTCRRDRGGLFMVEDFMTGGVCPRGSRLAGDAKLSGLRLCRPRASPRRGTVSQTGATREDIARVLVYAPDARTHAAIARKLGFPDSAYPESPLIARLGDSGAAAPLLSLVDALQSAEPGEHIIVAGHGSGGEAILLRATDKVHSLRTQRGVGWSVERARAIPNYGQWLKFNGLSPEEEIKPFTSPSILWKENRATMRLMAGVCRSCGELQYPRQQVCNACGTRDEWDERKLSRRGKIFTFIHDYLPPSPEGFITMATVELEGGGRFYGQMTSQVKDDVHIGMECELTFRLLHQGDGYYNYFWKLRPAE